MRINLDYPPAVEREIELSDGQRFTLTLRPPTAGEKIKDKAAMIKAATIDEAQWRWRLGFIAGWRGIEDQDGEAIPFSAAALDQVLRDDDILSSVLIELHRFFNESLAEARVKNLPRPPDVSGAAV